MFIDFNKISEGESTVTYVVDTTVTEKIQETINQKIAKGYCIFDKITETITYDPARTDSFFFERELEPLYILIHLKKLNKKKHFPEKYSIATGG